MPRTPKHSVNPNGQTNASSLASHIDRRRQLPLTGSGRTPEQDREASAYVLAELLSRDDGWLRIVPHTLDNVVYFKWKFTRGPWNAHYVMSRVESWQIAYGLDLLLDKLHAVDEGTKRPTKDTAYSEV